MASDSEQLVQSILEKREFVENYITTSLTGFILDKPSKPYRKRSKAFLEKCQTAIDGDKDIVYAFISTIFPEIAVSNNGVMCGMSAPYSMYAFI
jgi:hypothetical protein